MLILNNQLSQYLAKHIYNMQNFNSRSLGCIVYELVVGSPPFQTTSILHLVRLIRFEAIKWPDYISQNCKQFLQVVAPL